jgi:hypothetical protein
MVPLFFDLETVPDESRLHTFGLAPVPPPPAETPADALPPAESILAASIDGIKERLAPLIPSAEYCDALTAAERAGKNRSGVYPLIAAARSARQTAIDATAERCKLLSTTPEYCRIAALGWATGDEQIRYGVAADPAGESALLDKFWELAATAGPLVGFNIIGFDLPVILVRSAILGIPAARSFDLKPYAGNRDVIDVYLGRFGPKGNTNSGRPGKLKQLAALMGIPVPAEGCDGSQVYDLLRTDPKAVGAYVKSDVEITRAYYQKLRGFFWN